MKRKVQKGFTLIELIIAMLIGAIVVVVAGMILFFSQKNWNNAWQRVKLQRDASYAVLRMSRSVKAGASAQVEGSGECLRIYTGGNWTRFYVAPGLEKLALKSEVGGNSETILDDGVEALQFNVADNTIRIELKLREDNLQAHFVSTVMMRNFGG